MARCRTHPWIAAGLLLLAAGAMAQTPSATVAVNPPAAAFDALFRQIDSPDWLPASPAHARRSLQRLHALLPAGDGRRTRQYAALRCNLDFEDAQVDGLTFARHGLAQARQAGDLDAQVRFQFCLGSYLETVETPDAARIAYGAGVDLARRLEQPRLLGDGLTLRGGVSSLVGEQALALLDFLEAQRVYEGAGLTTSAEANLLNLAIAYRRMGEYAPALHYLGQSETFAARERDWPTLLVTMLQLGFLHEEQGHTAPALTAFRRALQLAQRHSTRSDVGFARLGMAAAYISGGRYTQALRALKQANDDFEAIGDSSNRMMITFRSGQAHAGLGHHRQALRDYASAAPALEADDNPRYLAMLYRARAHSHEAVDDNAAALADLKRYIQVRTTLDAAARSQQSMVLRHQFDATRRDLENQRLTAEKALQLQQVSALLKTRRWQWAALAMGGLLLLGLATLVARQLVGARRLQVLALTDALTGVANRRRIELFATEAITRALAQNTPVTVITFDIDYFKRINDGFGHAVGDMVLAAVARTCHDTLRQFDLLGRTGGEEFLVVLPYTTCEQAVQIAERLRANVAALDLGGTAPGLQATISLGVAQFEPRDATLKELVRRADIALYRAKANGRNRVEVEV